MKEKRLSLERFNCKWCLSRFILFFLAGESISFPNFTLSNLGGPDSKQHYHAMRKMKCQRMRHSLKGGPCNLETSKLQNFADVSRSEMAVSCFSKSFKEMD
jgi:hypothetical protein